MTISKSELENLKIKLEKERQDLEAELKNLPDAPDLGSDIDSFEEETDEAEEMTTNISIKQVLRQRLGDIEAALEKIKSGIYGRCEKCEKEIELDLLNVDPESRFCRDCKKPM